MSTLGIAGLICIASGVLLSLIGMFVLGAGGIASMGKMIFSIFKRFGQDHLTHQEMEESEASAGKGMLTGMVGFFGSMGVSFLIICSGGLASFVGIVLVGLEVLQHFGLL